MGTGQPELGVGLDRGGARVWEYLLVHKHGEILGQGKDFWRVYVPYCLRLVVTSVVREVGDRLADVLGLAA